MNFNLLPGHRNSDPISGEQNHRRRNIAIALVAAFAVATTIVVITGQTGSHNTPPKPNTSASSSATASNSASNSGGNVTNQTFESPTDPGKVWEVLNDAGFGNILGIGDLTADDVTIPPGSNSPTLDKAVDTGLLSGEIIGQQEYNPDGLSSYYTAPGIKVLSQTGYEVKGYSVAAVIYFSSDSGSSGGTWAVADAGNGYFDTLQLPGEVSEATVDKVLPMFYAALDKTPRDATQ